MTKPHCYILTLTCPDRSGIVAAVTQFIASHQGWIIEASQYSDPSNNWFFMRVVILTDSLPFGLEEFSKQFVAIANDYQMQWQITDNQKPKNVVILVSKHGHCLADLLYRWQAKELECNIEAVISNHPDTKEFVRWHDINYHHIPMLDEQKTDGMLAVGELLAEYAPDVIVLARFMQILPKAICEEYPGQIINIHHGFLPSFVGAKPYEQAYHSGVKLIGATSHYVTTELDTGPIIEQDVIRVNHNHSVENLIHLGRDIEKNVLARAVQYHLEDRVLIHHNKTVVFA